MTVLLVYPLLASQTWDCSPAMKPPSGMGANCTGTACRAMLGARHGVPLRRIGGSFHRWGWAARPCRLTPARLDAIAACPSPFRRVHGTGNAAGRGANAVAVAVMVDAMRAWYAVSCGPLPQPPRLDCGRVCGEGAIYAHVGKLRGR